jgi:hypothetical protein
MHPTRGCPRLDRQKRAARHRRTEERNAMSQVNVDPSGDGGSGVNAVAVVAIVILVLLAFLAVYFLFLGDDADADADVDVGSPTTHAWDLEQAA